MSRYQGNLSTPTMVDLSPALLPIYSVMQLEGPPHSRSYRLLLFLAHYSIDLNALLPMYSAMQLEGPPHSRSYRLLLFLAHYSIDLWNRSS